MLGAGQKAGPAVRAGRELRRANVQEARDRSVHGARYPPHQGRLM